MLARPFLKIIAGIENDDLINVEQVLDAALFCEVEAVDVSAEPRVLNFAKEKLHGSQIKLFASSLDVAELDQAARLGADYLELGNYDELYTRGQRFTPEKVLHATTELLELGRSNLSITIPGYLNSQEQIDLALKLTELGINLLQVEGGSLASAESSGSVGHIEKAKITLANTLELYYACPDAQILAAGGLSSLTVPLALAAGASGIGIGKAISRLGSTIEMIAMIQSIQNAIQTQALALV
ncbi:MAG: DUF561 domain-containing protein [Candidatus Caenarcaniphilales bacterium]|nr:DUF561 domain-containing protein [Candidatus Caenarcaniphilales bacterium]